MKIGNFDKKELPQALEDRIKEETFDEFLQLAYHQLTPEEQTQVRQKS
jgi:hypothetical protein